MSVNLGQKLTISHSSDKGVRLVIGSSPATLRSNLTNFYLDNVYDTAEHGSGVLGYGECIQYTCSSKENGAYDAHYVCIQCPSDYGVLNGLEDVVVQLETGDINFDGRVDIEDYNLLAKYVAYGAGSSELHWTPTPKQLAVMNCRKDETSPRNRYERC